MAFDKNWHRVDLPVIDTIPVTPGATDLANGPTKAILLDADGTIDYLTTAGTARTGVPLAGKVMHRLAAQRITACTANCWACY
jgi:hypothetical protein